MRPSVIQGVSDRPLGAGQELDSLNNEVRPVLRAAREVVNQESRFKATATSAGSLGAYQRVWESEEGPTTGAWTVEARVTGLDTAGNVVGYILRAVFQFSVATVAQVGATDTFSRESTAAPDARFGVDTAARTVYVEVLDDGAHVMSWAAVVSVLEVA